jgi:hypothetical protein
MRVLEEECEGVAWTSDREPKIRANDTIPNHLT